MSENISGSITAGEKIYPYSWEQVVVMMENFGPLQEKYQRLMRVARAAASVEEILQQNGTNEAWRDASIKMQEELEAAQDLLAGE